LQIHINAVVVCKVFSFPYEKLFHKKPELISNYQRESDISACSSKICTGSFPAKFLSGMHEQMPCKGTFIVAIEGYIKNG